MPLEGKPRAEATAGGWLLYRYQHRHNGQLTAEFLAHQSCKSSILAAILNGIVAAPHVRDHDDGIQSEGDGKFCNTCLPKVGRVVRYGCYRLRMHRSHFQFEGQMTEYSILERGAVVSFAMVGGRLEKLDVGPYCRGAYVLQLLC